MKKLLIVFNLTLFLFFKAKAQDAWGVYINASNTSLINKDAHYTKSAFNSIGDFAEREPFYGELLKISPTWHKGFGLWYKIPFEKDKFSCYLVVGVATYGHKENLNGGKSENYPYGLSYNSLPPGDSSIKITNKFYNYFFSIGPKVELKIYKKISLEIQVNFNINKNNHDMPVKAFRSVFSSKAQTNSGASNTGKDIAYNDVNYKGIVFLQGGVNYQIKKRFKLHALFSISGTSVNKYTKIDKLYYRGVSFQLSYSFW